MRGVKKRLALLLAMLALGAVVSGCDKCGDWFGKPGACKEALPR
jgi:hypothetical protein